MQKSPPRYVPTLTQVVASQPGDAAGALQLNEAAVQAAAAASMQVQPTATDIAQQLRQQLLVRTRQYIDIELQRRIRETASQLALEYAHKLFEEIQPQLEATITQVVDEALQQAVAHAAAHDPAHTPSNAPSNA